jgi:hypothetical protein
VRILVLTPAGRDAAVAASVLSEQGLVYFPGIVLRSMSFASASQWVSVQR